MYESTQRVAAYNTQQPQNEQNYKKCPKHVPTLICCELYKFGRPRVCGGCKKSRAVAGYREKKLKALQNLYKMPVLKLAAAFCAAATHNTELVIDFLF